MKKTLMVLTFALCATFAFAQTAGPRMTQESKATTKVQAQNDLNKALFTKEGTLLTSIDFHDGDTAGGTGYVLGVVNGGTEAHTQNYAFAKWRRWANIQPVTLNAMQSVYTTLAGLGNFDARIANMVDTAVSSGENGFMMMSMIDQSTPQSGTFNAYIQTTAIDASSAGVVEVDFYQSYRKYYDRCYMDYSIDGGNTWSSLEINVTGIDVDVNGDMHGFIDYTLPIAAAGASDLRVRVRWFSDGSRGNAYGYWWVIDDMTVTAQEADRMKYYSQEYVEGNYGLIPQGMSITPAWYDHVLNNGANPRSNITASLTHLNADQSVATEIASFNNGNLNALNNGNIVCDPRGWILIDSTDYRGWYGYGFDGAHGTLSNPLPTNTPGANYIYAKIETDMASADKTFDTMYYNVTTLDPETQAYRWGHDNGVLTYSPYNYYIIGYVYSSGNWYITEDADEVHYYSPGYSVTTRYTTDVTVPNNWVIRGVELVASPARDFHSTGVKLSAVLMKDEYNGNSVSFPQVVTGAGILEISDDDVNDSTVIGRNTHGYRELGEYNTATILFPEQPALEASSSYRVGYSLEEEGYFALAYESYNGSYREASPTRPDTYDTIYYFRNNENTKKYAHPFQVNQYQNYFADPSNTSERNSTFASYYTSTQPMIRLLVGPAQEVTRVTIGIECDSTEYGEVSYGGEPVCGSSINPVEGSTPTLVLVPVQGGAIDKVYVDGQLSEPYDEIEELGDPNYKIIDGIGYYRYANVTGDHTIRVVFKEAVAIDPVAANVSMNLQPNPATSQVRLSVEGVNGQLSCAIIDMSGRVVYESMFNAENGQSIDLRSLAKGAYFVRITNDTFSKVEKLIVR